MTAVFDTNVVVSAAFWQASDDRRCFIFVARRRCRMALSDEIWDEYREVTERLRIRGCLGKNPAPFLNWIASTALRVEPAPLGRQRSRDAKDDPFLACALAARAEVVVSKDRDLLALGKPFGVEILTPRSFIRRLK